MNKYLIHYKQVGKLIKLNMRETAAEELGKMQSDFAEQVSPGTIEPFKFADLFNMNIFFVTRNGMFYEEELAGPGGMNFTLLVLPKIPREAVVAAKNQLYRDRDVVHIRELRIKELIIV